MTQLQKIVAKAKILKKSYHNTKWTDLIKKASKLVTPASKSFAGTKKVIKKSPLRSLHKDTKSHNVNIRVMSGTLKGLPDNFTGMIGNVKFYVHKQFSIYGNVEAVIYNQENDNAIISISGSVKEIEKETVTFLHYVINKSDRNKLDYDETKKRIKKFISELSKEVRLYNSKKSVKAKVKKVAVKKYAPVKPLAKKKTILKKSPVKRSRSSESEKIRSTVKKDGFIMPHGYGVAKAKRISGYVGRIIIKKYTLTELKKLNPNFFSKKIDQHFGIYSKKLIVSTKLNSQVLVEASKQKFGNDIFRSYTVREITPSGEILKSNRFDNLLSASNFIGKNIIL